MYHITAATIILACTASAAFSYGDTSKELITECREKGFDAWKRQHAANVEIEGKFFQYNVVQGKKSTLAKRGELQSDGTCSVFREYLSPESDSPTLIICRNSQYGFLVEPAESKAGDYRLGSLIKRRDDEKAWANFVRLRFNSRNKILFESFGIPLWDFFAEPTCKFINANLKVEGGEHLVEIEFVRDVKTPTGIEADSVHRGKATFNRSKQWTPIRFEFTAKAGNQGDQISIAKEFDIEQEGEIVLLAGIRDYILTGGNYVLLADSAYDLNVNTERYKEKDFTLTSFGLTEPPGTSVLHTSIPYWLVFGLAGIAVFAIAMLLRWRRR